jgi:hypothetical protein
MQPNTNRGNEMRHGTWLGTTDAGMDIVLDDLDMTTEPVNPDLLVDTELVWGEWDDPETVGD